MGHLENTGRKRGGGFFFFLLIIHIESGTYDMLPIKFKKRVQIISFEIRATMPSNIYALFKFD
jgi:hypothetical protein